MYINGDMDRNLEEIRKYMEERETDRKTIIWGDFNARTGKEGGSVERDIGEEEEKGRESKDEKTRTERN